MVNQEATEAFGPAFNTHGARYTQTRASYSFEISPPKETILYLFLDLIAALLILSDNLNRYERRQESCLYSVVKDTFTYIVITRLIL